MNKQLSAHCYKQDKAYLALLAGRVAGVGPRVGEALSAVLALERLLARVDALVLLKSK
jgi:hypothetical protein